MLRGVIAALFGATMASCASEGVLPLPEVPGVVAWVVVVSDQARLLRAEAIAPDGAVRVSADEGRVEALAFTEPLGIASGPIAPAMDGDLLPDAAASYTAELGALEWTSAPPSGVAQQLRLPRVGDDCPAYSSETVRLSDDEHFGASGIGPSAAGRIILTPGRWFLVTETETQPVTPLVTGAIAISGDPTGGSWIATSQALWRVVGPDLMTATATAARPLPPGLDPFSIASPMPGVVYGIGQGGRLFRSDSSTVTIVHVFASGPASTRGMIIRDGQGVLAGLGTDPTFVRVENTTVQRYTLPSASEGVVSIARYGDYGVVVGTNQGIIRAESLGFEPVPDPLDQMPRGVQLRVLRVSGARLYFGGNSGTFGEITPRGFLCQSPVFAATGVRFLSELGDQIVAVGVPFEATPSDINLTRFTAQP